MVNNTKDKQGFSDRLNAVLDAANVINLNEGRQGYIGKMFGVSGNGARKWLLGEAIPKYEMLCEIVDKYKSTGVTIEWLLSGNPELSPFKGKISEINNSYTTAQPKTIYHDKEFTAHSQQRIPLLSWLRAGAFCEADGQFSLSDAEELLPAPLDRCGPRLFALTVRGDSMDTPDGYREGEIVYIDPDVIATPGKDVLAKTQNGATLKRYKEDEDGPYLLQLNGNKIIRPAEAWSICGVVVFSGRKR